MKTDPEYFRNARAQLLKDGYCIVDGELPEGMSKKLLDWSNRWIEKTPHTSKWKYQGSDIHISGVRNISRRVPNFPQDEIVDFLIEHPRQIMVALRLEDLHSGGTFQIISKPPKAPALYWHQDWARWDDPLSMAPWPQQVFLNWYLSDTSKENGCLRVIPGSHLKRLDLHSHLVKPHEGGGYDVTETDEWMFYDHPQAIDVKINVGELLIADARLLHSTHPNISETRRTVLLGWFYRNTSEIPSDWNGAVPQEILDREPHLRVDFNREPGAYLK